MELFATTIWSPNTRIHSDRDRNAQLQDTRSWCSRCCCVCHLLLLLLLLLLCGRLRLYAVLPAFPPGWCSGLTWHQSCFLCFAVLHHIGNEDAPNLRRIRVNCETPRGLHFSFPEAPPSSKSRRCSSKGKLIRVQYHKGPPRSDRARAAREAVAAAGDAAAATAEARRCLLTST